MKIYSVNFIDFIESRETKKYQLSKYYLQLGLSTGPSEFPNMHVTPEIVPQLL